MTDQADTPTTTTVPVELVVELAGFMARHEDDQIRRAGGRPAIGSAIWHERDGFEAFSKARELGLCHSSSATQIQWTAAGVRAINLVRSMSVTVEVAR